MMWGLLSEDEFAEVIEALEKVGVKLTRKQFEELREMLVI